MSNKKEKSTRASLPAFEAIGMDRRRIVGPEHLRASASMLDVVGVLNAAAARTVRGIDLFARVDEVLSPDIRRDHIGGTAADDAIPYYDIRNRQFRVLGIRYPSNYDRDFDPVIVVDSENEAGHLNEVGIRITYAPHIRRIGLDVEYKIVEDRVLFRPTTEFEQFGSEDPRTYSHDTGTFVLYNGIGRYGAIPICRQMIDGERVTPPRILLPPDQKHPCMFSRTGDRRHFLMIRPLLRVGVKAAGIWLFSSEDMRCWKVDGPAILPRSRSWDCERVGPGPSPVATEHGWLTFYYGVDAEKSYHVGAALLDIDDPTRVVGRLRMPLFSPSKEWELNGRRADVVFPSGLDVQGERIDLYYGAADTSIGVASFLLPELIALLLRHS